MSERNHDHNPKQQQAQDALPRGRLHVNGAQDGPVSPASGGKGGGNKSPPGNGKAPPGNGSGGGEGNLRDRVTTLEANMATKPDLHKVETNLRAEVQASEERLRTEAQASEERLRKGFSEAIEASEGRLDKRLDKLTTVLMWGAGILVAILLAAA